MSRNTWMVTRAAAVVLLAGMGCQSGPKTTTVRLPSNPALSPEVNKTALAAQRAADEGKIDDAIALYRQTVDKAPGHAIAWNNLGELLLSQRKFLEAAEALNKAANESPTMPEPLINLGLIYHELGHSTDALRYYEEALGRDSGNQKALRGAVLQAKLLNIADRTTEERIKLAQMAEPDPAWQQLFAEELLRVRQQLRDAEQNDAARARAN